MGCGSALPTLKHQPTSQVVEVRDKVFMIDCGEGTQTALRRSHVCFSKISAVFISHLHGDHCFGLIGMISTFGLLGRTAPLHIYAPAAFEDILNRLLQFFCHDFDYQVVFHAVDTTIEAVIYEDRSLTVSSIPLDHRVPCCGFLFREKPSLPHIRREKIDFYRISISQINSIKNGADGITPEGEVIPHDKLVRPAEPPRSYAYCSDTRYNPQLCSQISKVNVLYHEATYTKDQMEHATRYFHSTAGQAAQIAKAAGVKQLLIGHYSARYDDETVLLDEAKEIFENTHLTNEGMVFDVR